MTRYGRTLFVASTIAASLMAQASAHANEQQTSPPSSAQSTQEPTTGLGKYTPATKEEKLVSCMALWDPDTHMSKTRWKTVCMRVQTNN
jgi:hypothetical protein